MKAFNDVLISPEQTILDALRIIDTGSKQIALVVDREQYLLGTITDGDIRRGILRGESLESPATSVMNSAPLTASLSDSKEKIFSLMKRRQLRQIPIINDKGQLVRIDLLDSMLNREERTNWVVLMAGGLGTRLSPLTDNCPKPLLKLGNKPILEIIMENFIESGFKRFYISVNYRAEMIEEYFGDGSKWSVEIRYLNETQRLGTAGALSLIDETPEEPMFVMNGDLLTKVNFQQLLEYHIETKALATMCVREYEYQVPYGVVKVDDHRLLSIEEKPTHKYFISGGIYVVDPKALDFVPSNSFYDMPTLFEQLIGDNQETTVFPIREYWLDIGRMDDFNRATGEYSENFG